MKQDPGGTDSKVERKSFDWLFDPSPAVISSPPPPYGDLTELNSARTILDAVGPALLREIASDVLGLVGTSSAVYEANGDYALGIFSSGWCRLLDSSSRRLCATESNEEALRSGRWLCHESCWRDASEPAIRTGEPVDVQCRGGINLFAVPIKVNGLVLGAINIGWGDPPTDPDTLHGLATAYGVDEDTLLKQAEAYENRPPFIVNAAKRRLESAAHLIGEIVRRWLAETALEQADEQRAILLDNLPLMAMTIEKGTRNIVFSNALAREKGAVSGAKCYETLMGRSQPCPFCLAPEVWTAKEPREAEVEYGGRSYQAAWLPLSEDHFVHYVEDISDRKAAEAALARQRDEIRALGAKLEAVREEERVVLARELHDEVGQTLVAMRMDMGALQKHLTDDQAEAAERVHAMLHLADGAIRRVNRISNGLRSPILDLLGLHTAIESHAADTSDWAALDIQTKLDVSRLETHRDRDLTVFKIFQEALSNVVRHAEATRATIRLFKEDQDLVLEVSDNGVGIPPEQARDPMSLGLAGMRERAEWLGGKFQIEAPPSGGTSVQARLPILPSGES